MFREAVWLANVQRAAVLEVVRDAGGPEAVAADPGPDVRKYGSPADHPPDVGGAFGISPGGAFGVRAFGVSPRAFGVGPS